MFDQKYQALFQKIQGSENHQEEISKKMQEELDHMKTQNNLNSSHRRFYKYAAVAASIVLITAAGYRFLNLEPAKVPVAVVPTQTQTVPVVQANTPVLYSQLNFAAPVAIKAPAAVIETGGKIAPFTEELLTESSAVIKGTVTGIRFKDYKSPEGTGEVVRQTVIYEITVDKTYFSKFSLNPADLLIIENDLFTYTSLANSVDQLKVGRQYLLPLYDNGESLDPQGGPDSPESNLSVLYPFAPQIEITRDGEYVFPDHWATLVNDSAQTITMDGEASGYYGEMKLRADAAFEADFQKTVDTYLK